MVKNVLHHICNNEIIEQLTILNQCDKEMNEVYHWYAKHYGMTDTTLWILYSLHERSTAYTQSELCADWYYPPQTINSSLKKMESQNLITLIPIPNNKKNKQILLSQKGEELAKKIIAPLKQAEQSSFQQLSEQDRQMLLSILQKYTAILQSETNKTLELSLGDVSSE